MTQNYDPYASGNFRTLTKSTAGDMVPTTGDFFFRIDVLIATTFTALTDASANTGDALTGVVIPVGTTLYGRFSKFNITAGGLVRAYISGR